MEEVGVCPLSCWTLPCPGQVDSQRLRGRDASGLGGREQLPIRKQEATSARAVLLLSRALPPAAGACPVSFGLLSRIPVPPERRRRSIHYAPALCTLCTLSKAAFAPT